MPPSVASPRGVVVQTITSSAELESLSEPWWSLWRRCSDSTPFQSPAWLIPWWRHFGSGRLSSLALLHDDRLIGLVPFYVTVAEPGEVRAVRLLGSGISDYLDVLIEPEFRREAIQVVADWLRNQRDWDECTFEQLRQGSPLLDTEAFSGLVSEFSEGVVCPGLQLRARVEGLVDVIPRSMVENVGYYRRRLDKGPPWRCELADTDSFAELFEALLKLHGARWSERGVPGVLACAQLRQFHRAAAFELMKHDVLRLYGLRVGSEIVATLYGFFHQQVTMYYLSGFDPKWRAVSPGSVLIAHAIEQTIEEKGRYFDFLRGQERYKQLWGAEPRRTFRRRLLHPRVGR